MCGYVYTEINQTLRSDESPEESSHAPRVLGLRIQALDVSRVHEFQNFKSAK